MRAPEPFETPQRSRSVLQRRQQPGGSRAWTLAVLAILACVGCKSSRYARETEPPDIAPPPSGAAPEGSVHSDVQPTCLSRAEIESPDRNLLHLSYLINTELSVVRVAPDDRLNLRSKPSARAPVVSKLLHDRAGLEPTGEVCDVAGKYWLQVRADGKDGWVRETFVRAATPARDATPVYRNLLGDERLASAEATSERLIARLRKAAAPESPYQVELIGNVVTEGSSARFELWKCCEQDDSVMGEQISVHLKKASRGWTLSSAQVRTTCYRGVHGTLCT